MSQPIHDPDAVASFYHLRASPVPCSACRGIACFAARADNPDCWNSATEQSPQIYCLGQCHSAPAVSGEDTRPDTRLAADAPVLTKNILDGGIRDVDTYLARDGGEALRIARHTTPAELIKCITDSGLRGRGGAGFSAGRKWSAVYDAGESPILVVNADEGDPGAYSDKALLEDDPFRLIEGIAIAAHAINARDAIIYLRCEYPEAARILQHALTESKDTGWPDDVRIELIVGQGSYVCGEETSLLNALEHRRPFARHRPPYPFENGLHGRPTLVHNVETLCATPWIVEHGPTAYSNLGAGDSAGTKLISLNSLFHHPGVVEIPFGISVRQIVEDIGGGLKRDNLLGVMIGGPLAGMLPPNMLDTPFTYDDLHAVGCAIGHGGVIAFADDTSIAELIAEIFRFGATESCGLCVPCHLGTAELVDAFNRILSGYSEFTHERWDQLITALQQTSLCGHGSGLAEFARSIEQHFPEELAACLL